MATQIENKQMAIISKVSWHPNDERRPGLFLNVQMDEAVGCLLIVPPEEVWEFFEAYGLVTSEGLRFADLKGKAVWVREVHPNVSELVGPCVI